MEVIGINISEVEKPATSNRPMEVYRDITQHQTLNKVQEHPLINIQKQSSRRVEARS